MKNWLRSEWPLVAILGLWIFYLASQFLAMHGAISFASDDAYMRLAIGRTLAQTGTWGINPGEFASTVGTLLWPLLLAGMDSIVGSHKANPLALNVILSCLLVIALDRAARRVISNQWLRCLATALAIFALPLAPLVLEGMEHTLQILFVLILLDSLLRVLEQSQWGWRGVVGASVALTATRYEGIFVVVLVAVALLASSRKQIPLAFTVLAAGAIPILIYGWISSHNGWLPVPSDVYFRRAPLVPDNLSGVWQLLLRPLDLLNQDATLRVLVLAPLIGMVWSAYAKVQTEARHRSGLRLLILLGVVLLQLYFIGVRQARYDAFIVVMGWWAVLPWVQTALNRFRAEKLPAWSVSGAAFGLLAVLLFFPLVNRGVSETISWWQARADFRDMQLAVVSSLKREAPDSVVATDFPGAFSFNGFLVLDLTGMASANLARARRAGGIRPEDIETDALLRQSRMAAVNDPAVRSLLPSAWLERGSIKIPDAAGGYQTIILFDIH
jgi:hypothetical protein